MESVGFNWRNDEQLNDQIIQSGILDKLTLHQSLDKLATITYDVEDIYKYIEFERLTEKERLQIFNLRMTLFYMVNDDEDELQEFLLYLDATLNKLLLANVLPDNESSDNLRKFWFLQLYHLLIK